MAETINIYCDESCHLDGDGQPNMVLGAVWCPLAKAHEIAGELRALKRLHALSPNFELKWNKVSFAKIDFYLDILDYFFDNPDLHFRALIADKRRLDHDSFGQDHDTWYYKMYFDMLKVLFSPNERFRIYIDYKDTHGARKVVRLHHVLANNMYDFRREIIERVQLVRSHEIEQIQLADLLIGVVSYANRGLSGNAGKQVLVDRMRERSAYQLTRSTLLGEKKVNLFHWTPREVQT